MRINSINNTTSFGYRTICDIGASNPKGTLKVSVQSDDGKVLFKKKGYVNDTVSGFKNSEDFVNKIDKIVKDTHKEVMEKCKNGEISLKGDDKKLSGVAVFVPGTTYTKGKSDNIAFIPNLRDKQGESLTNINFDNYEEKMKTAPTSVSGVDVNKDNFELVVTKDLGGCGLGISKILAQKNQLKEGDYIMGVMTGGGFGSVDIKVNDGKVNIETSESSNYLTGNISAYPMIADKMKEIASNGDSTKALSDIEELSANNFEKLNKEIPVANKLGRQGVSVKSHIAKFLHVLGKDELAPMVIAAGDARIVEDNIMYVDNNDKGLIEEIRKHPEFVEVESDKSDKTVFKMNEDLIGKENLKHARTEAVNDYADAISLIAINKINDCLNKIVLVGPFAHGVDRHIREHQEDYGAKSLPDLIKQKVDKNIDVIDLPTSRRLVSLYGFDVICDPDINFSDNTFAGDALLDKNLKFTANRGSWFNIPIENLADKSVETK